MATQFITTDGYVQDALRMQIRLAQAHLEGETEKPDIRLGMQSVNAYIKALDKWARGVRPQPVGRGEYTVPSATNAGAVYLTSGERCTCPNGQHGGALAFCWHQALVIALELAADGLDRDDDIPLPEPQFDIEEWF